MNKEQTNHALDELALYLRPPGQGIHTVSSGKSELERFTQNYLGSSWSLSEPWKNHLKELIHLKGSDAVAILAVPHDTGAGIVRGANRGPEAIRKGLGHAPVFELGDVFTVPQLLDDEMLSDFQKEQTQNAIYSYIPLAQRAKLPVSPISLAERVYQLVELLNPQLRILLLGGDHTVTWPAIKSLLKNEEHLQDTGILHFDAHTDLLPQRLGINYCFATWAYHANELIGRKQHLLQIGIRSSNEEQAYWENKFEVKQIWAKEALGLTPDELADRVLHHFKKIGIKHLFISNDLDGTDSQWAAACGTPEPDGLTREHILTVIQRIAELDIHVIGADLVELAPGLSLSQEASQISIETAVQYVQAELKILAKCF